MTQRANTLQIDQLPLNVKQVQVDGIKHTSTKVPVAYLQAINDCRSFKQLNTALKVVMHHMMGTGLYSDVKFSIIEAADAQPSEFSSNVSVFCEVTERNRYTAILSADSSLDQAHVNGKATVSLLNPINGLGESLQLSVAANPGQTVRGGSIALRDMYNGLNSRVKYHIDASSYTTNRPWANNTAATTNTFTLGGTSYDDASCFELILQQRHETTTLNALSNLTHNAASEDNNNSTTTTTSAPSAANTDPYAITSDDSLRPAVRYTYINDTRDIPHAPHRGKFFKSALELNGGLGQHPIQAKWEGQYQEHIPITKAITTSITLRGGVQQPLRSVLNAALNVTPETTDFVDVNEAYPEIPASDRFYAKGNYTRGVDPTATGPRFGTAVLGGDVFATATVSTSMTIPDLPIGLHAFWNVTHMSSVATMLREKWGGKKIPEITPSYTSTSVGIGAIAQTIFGRAEVNLSSRIKDYTIMSPKMSTNISLDW